MKFRKRPVVVEAIQYDGKNVLECLKFLGHLVPGWVETNDYGANVLCFCTNGLTPRTHPGMWIVRDNGSIFVEFGPAFSRDYEELPEVDEFSTMRKDEAEELPTTPPRADGRERRFLKAVAAMLAETSAPRVTRWEPPPPGSRYILGYQYHETPEEQRARILAAGTKAYEEK